MCGENMKLAVVDDEKIFREKFCEMIEKYYGDIDLICRQFADGKDIIEAYKNGKSFDAVFLDIEMRELDGLETAPRRFAISKRNNWMIQHSSFAICYVHKITGGAAKFREKAERKGLKVIDVQ